MVRSELLYICYVVARASAVPVFGVSKPNPMLLRPLEPRRSGCKAPSKVGRREHSGTWPIRVAEEWIGSCHSARMSTVVLVGFLALSLANLGTSSQRRPEGFLAEAKSGRGPGVLVLHPWWGLNADVKAFCNRLADSGFIAFAPDLFHGKTATTVAEAEALTKAHQAKDLEIQAQIAEGAKYLAERSGEEGIAVVGFSFGAYYALQFSNAEPTRVRAAVIFYGTGPEDFSKAKAEYLGHFAEKDEFEPRESVDGLAKLLRNAGRTATIHTYPGTGHWFFEPSVKQSYDEAAADLAWERTLQFLRKNFPTKSDGG